MSVADLAKPLMVMGLMSGTSVDGVDACLARIAMHDGHLQQEMIATYTQDIAPALRSRLLKAMSDPVMGLEALCALNVAVGELFAEAALGLLRTHHILAGEVDCIGSHGQTLFHWPPPPVQSDDETGTKRPLGGTLQIGEPSIIAEKTGIYTIADFRPRDMAAGGQGAPLVCYADRLLFQDEHYTRCIQNIGGIANVTVVPPRSTEQAESQPVMAFDTGPGNMLMDAAMMHFYGKPYDENGAVAATGTIHEALLVHLLGHPYLPLTPPKTTGREQFGEPFFKAQLAQFPGLEPADWLATLTEFTAQTIVDSYQRFIFPRYQVSEMILGGGGAYNAHLRQRLEHHLKAAGQVVSLKMHADFGIHDKYKEALAFAILAWAAFQRQPNNLPECTGASHPVIMGKHCF